MKPTTRHRFLLATGLIAACAIGPAAQSAQSSADDEVARRQLESGRAFVRQGNYAEALKDFRAVAETHGGSSVADNAWLELARYYLDVVGDAKEAGAAVDAILKTYPTSDSAPDAYVMAGRLELAKGQTADLDAALANFERVARLFPASEAVPRSLVFAAEAHRQAGRLDVALGNLMRVASEYPRERASADAYLAAGTVFLGQGDPIGAMEQLQQVRNGWPGTPEAGAALAKLSILYRLYVRGAAGPAFQMAADPVGPARLRNVDALEMSASGALYWANDQTAGVVLPESAPAAPAGGKPRGLVVDAAGTVGVLDASAIRAVGGGTTSFLVARGTGATEPLERADAAVQLANGDWLVMDEHERGVQRFARSGTYIGPFAQAKLSRMTLSPAEDIVGLDRDEKVVLFYDQAGKITNRVPLKATGYELSNPVDVAFDALGHLYVLDRNAIAVFSPYPASTAARASAPPAKPVPGRPLPPPATPAVVYRLVTLFSEPQSNQTGLRRATAFALGADGTVFLYDERAERVLVYR